MASVYDKEIRQEPDMLHRVLRLLYTSHQPSFSKVELERIGVTVGPFDISNPLFINDNKQCLFQPFDEHEIKRWEIPAYAANWEGMKARLDLPAVDPNSQLAQSLSPSEINKGNKDVLAFLNTNFTFRSNGATRLCTELGWSVIDPRVVHSRNKHFLFSGHGSQLGANFPSWQVWSIQVWREKNHAGHDYQTGPSIRLIISTDAIGPFDRILLNELGAITECLAFRRTQREYTPYPIIPILVLSLFGPRSGRIIQASYEVLTGKIGLLISPILSFSNKNDPSFDLFLRFMASYPPESNSLDQALARMSISSPPPGLDLAFMERM